METVPVVFKEDLDMISQPDMRTCHASNSMHIKASPKNARKGATLTSELAQEIFLVRVIPEGEDELSAPGPPRLERSVVVSEIYGVSPKTVRDVWNRSALSWYLWLDKRFECITHL